jgi:hypothetical protein
MKQDELKIYQKHVQKDTRFFIRPYWLRNFFRGINNLIIWLPTIWKDRGWDDHYIFEILKKKLLLQRKCLVNDSNFTSIDQVNRDITICLNLIERFQTSYYEVEYQNYCKTEFEWKAIEDSDNKQLEIKTLWEDFDSFFKKYPSSLRALKKQKLFDGENEKNKDCVALLLSSYNHEKCKKLLFRILSEHIDHWWD